MLVLLFSAQQALSPQLAPDVQQYNCTDEAQREHQHYCRANLKPLLE
jgi:hypothetical protein